MANRVIIEGYNISEYDFSDNYDLTYFGFETGDIDGEGCMVDTIPNVSVQIYSCPTKCTLEDAQEKVIQKFFGDMSLESQDTGYSEYTITGFDVDSVKIGNHDLIEILRNIKGYKIVVIERTDKSN